MGGHRERGKADRGDAAGRSIIAMHGQNWFGAGLIP
jgi:hypothetical protein